MSTGNNNPVYAIGSCMMWSKKLFGEGCLLHSLLRLLLLLLLRRLRHLRHPPRSSE